MNMRQTIRLTESDLHSIIKQCINESYDDYDDYDEMTREESEAAEIARAITRGDYDDKLDKIVQYGILSYFDISPDNINYDWIMDATHERKCLIDKDYAMKYGHNPDNPNWLSQAHKSHSAYEEKYGNHTNHNRFNRKEHDYALFDEYWKDKENRETGAKFPHTMTKNGHIRKGNYRLSKLKSNLEKDTIGTDQADKRPLHRKGSLNRAGMPESRMRNIVRESVNKVLAEMSLHKGSSVHRHSSGNWAPSGEGWKWKYDGDRVDRYLWRMKKDAEKAGCVGPHKFPMAKWFGDNAYNYFNYISEYGGDLEHVPCITNEEDDYEMSPEDLYRAIDELCYGNEIGYDNMRTFG